MAAEVEKCDFPALVRARILWGKGLRAAALRAFQEAVSDNPRNIKALLETARAFGAAYRISEAEGLLGRAEALAERDPQLLTHVAATYGRIHREARAITLLESIHQRSPAAMAELAVLYENAGLLRQARDEISACISAAPHAAEPRLAQARILRRMGDSNAASVQLARLTRSRLPDALRAEAWTEQCYLADREGRARAALDAIENAHAIFRAHPKTGQLIARARRNNLIVTELARSFARPHVSRWQADARDQPRVAHLLGFPRSGTTLLEQWLDAHPDLVASPERAHFTTNILPHLAESAGGLDLASLDRLPEKVLGEARSRYLTGMAEAIGAPIGGRLHLDKNPNHTGLIPALVRLFPKSVFVVALRDPRDVITSCVLRSFRLTEFSAMLLDWETAVEIYAAEMGAWLRLRQMLPPEQWVETRYEDMVDDPRTEVTRVLDALGLGWHDDVTRWRERTQGKVLYSPTQTEARQEVYPHAVGRWRAYETALAPFLERLDPFVRAFGYAPA